MGIGLLIDRLLLAIINYRTIVQLEKTVLSMIESQKIRRFLYTSGSSPLSYLNPSTLSVLRA